MHDLGDMLVEAGFADPVMDQETITLTWPSGEALLAELRQLGGNVDPRRFAGLRTPRWRSRLAEALEARGRRRTAARDWPSRWSTATPSAPRRGRAWPPKPPCRWTTCAPWSGPAAAVPEPAAAAVALR